MKDQVQGYGRMKTIYLYDNKCVYPFLIRKNKCSLIIDDEMSWTWKVVEKYKLN